MGEPGEVDSGRRPGTSTADAQRIAELEREVRELRRANDMAIADGARADRSRVGNFSDQVWGVSGDRRHYLDQRWSLEQIAHIMGAEHGTPIAPETIYQGL